MTDGFVCLNERGDMLPGCSACLPHRSPHTVCRADTAPHAPAVARSCLCGTLFYAHYPTPPHPTLPRTATTCAAIGAWRTHNRAGLRGGKHYATARGLRALHRFYRTTHTTHCTRTPCTAHYPGFTHTPHHPPRLPSALPYASITFSPHYPPPDGGSCTSVPSALFLRALRRGVQFYPGTTPAASTPSFPYLPSRRLPDNTRCRLPLVWLPLPPTTYPRPHLLRA